ncbi:hypothetical protein WQ57_01505 [Mesobacillus campisalis]|uniref:Uncharacterized protein n=1 Tax=Mesobacillus campisalis TaxID=1408103 RepID=A0A0M2T580_9BACI|nr:PH domain-containing protein [Mesobacillus campisalis]KKK39975.1 hypothetical protein WQ57_01505 [Mesobacillus campisalis]
MGIYRTVSRKVEDVFVKVLAGKQDPDVVREKVAKYRTEADQKLQAKKLEKEKKRAQQRELNQQKSEAQERQRKENEERERKEVEALLVKVLENGMNGASPYEINEVKNNQPFFLNLVERVFEPNEKALTFIFCEFDKSSKKEIKGYLIPTNKRVLFLTKNLTFMDKFRYQTVINVNWFKDGLLERGLRIQYGKRKLEFDEMFDQEQMERVGNAILNKATSRAI